VSREHRRAKTDRLDTELLLRALLGWLRGEKRHCNMVAIPTIEDEDARCPNRERASLVTEQTRIVNQIKAILIRFGIRTFRPKLRKAEEQLKQLRSAEGLPLPDNTRAELYRRLASLRMVRDQIQAIEKARLQKLTADHGRKKGPHAMVRLIARVLGIGVETADMLVTESSRASSATARRLLATPALPAPQMRAANAGVRRAWHALERSRPHQHDPVRVAFSQIRTGQRPGPMVSNPGRRWARRHAQDHDRRLGAQAAHLTLASRHNRRTVGRHCPASGIITTAKRKGSDNNNSLAAPV
jgi:transposase